MSNNSKYIFKGSLFSAKFDMLAAKKLPGKMLKMHKRSRNTNIITNYNVNNLAKSLHPGKQELVVHDIIEQSHDTKTFVFKSKNNGPLAYFRAGQYLSLTVNLNGTLVSRPYSISSSPSEALNGIYKITIKRKPGGLISNYFLDYVAKGNTIIASGPEGDFYYDSIRDPKHILAIAGGSGITPFISMAAAIADGDEDFSLTIVYGSRTRNDILFEKELNELSQKTNNKVKVVYVISDEQPDNDGYEYGFIDLNIINKYKQDDSAIWMCGSKAMNKFVMKQIQSLNLARKLIRSEAHNDIGVPSQYPEYTNTGNKKVYNIVVKQFGNQWTIKANADETIIVSLQKAGISMQSKCLAGNCSWCRVKLNRGNIFVPSSYDNRRNADKYNNVYYSCCSFPVSDLEIEAN